MSFLANNKFQLLGFTVGGAVISLVLEKFYQGSAGVAGRYLKAGSAGAVAGGALGFSLLRGQENSSLSGRANWAYILGATGVAGGLLYQIVQKNYNTRALIKSAAIGSTVLGSAGAAITEYQKTI